MPTLAPDAAIAADLATALNAGGDPWAVGTNIFTGPVRGEGNGIPVRAVFVRESGGPAPMPYLGGRTADSFFEINVQVRLRAAPTTDDGFSAGRTLARRISAALNKADISGYMACQLMQATPNYLGLDPQGRHEWSVNVKLWISAANVPA